MVKKFLTSLASFLTLTLSLIPSVLAQDTINLVDSSSQYNYIFSLRPGAFVRTAINLTLGVAGVVGFLYLLWGGLQLITAGGDKDGIEKGRRKITFALIGLAATFSVYALMYVIQVLFGINLINFTINRIQ
jgi:threonine/homoserine/homoserine lactone efflux protein